MDKTSTALEIRHSDTKILKTITLVHFYCILVQARFVFGEFYQIRNTIS